MSAQKVATAVALTALAALFFSVGLPSLLPAPAVPDIVVPVGDTDDEPARPAGRADNPDDDDESGSDDDGPDSDDYSGAGDNDDDSRPGVDDSPDDDDDSDDSPDDDDD